MLFASLILEREPMAWADITPAVVGWVQSAGALAALGLLLYFVSIGFSFKKMFSPFGLPASPRLIQLGGIACSLSWIGFCLLGCQFLLGGLGLRAAQDTLPGARPDRLLFGDYLFAVSGALALAVVLYPIIRSAFFDMRMGRIWAVAKLSIKEAIRNKSIYVFGAMAIIFLFADWFIPYKAEDQVRNYVWVLYWSMIVLFLLSAGIFGSFGIPADIKNLNIHTVVTKPITKFEIVLGRFLGYGLILTVALFLVGFLSLGYVMRGVTEEATKESFLARVPVYGQLGFINTRGESVGREWDYRRYIGGLNMSGGKRQYAVWGFPDLSEIRPREDGTVRIEFAFDIFRLTKGEENKGILCTFKFSDGQTSADKVEEELEKTRRERTKLQEQAANQGKVDLVEANRKIDAELVKKYTVWEIPGVEVSDYHTLQVDVPYTLIERLREVEASQPADKRAWPMQVFVSIDSDRGSAAQMLGVAPRDLYILAAENDFYINFLKGLVGLWMSAIMVLGVAICCSTYLSGVISLLCTLFLFIAGFFTPSIGQLANNQGIGGGPAESFYRMVGVRTPMTVPLEESSTTSLIKGVDEIFRWNLRRVLTLIPDASRYDLHPYVANGFDISWTRILFLDCFLPLVGYLLPWFVLAYYLINYREIANPM